MPIFLSIASSIIAYLITKGAGKISKLLEDNRSEFVKRLSNLIDETIDEYSIAHPFEKENPGQCTFYKSDINIKELMKFRFYENYNFEKVIAEFDKNKNIVYEKDEVEEFFKLFEEKLEKDDLLKQLERNENYIDKIYENSEDLKEIKEIVSNLRPEDLKENPQNYNLPAPPEFFVGREKKLKEIHEKLSENEPLLLVNGLGGIGKTYIAQKYIYSPEYSKNYQRIFWIPIDTYLQDNFISHMQIALNLKFTEAKNNQDKLQIIKNALQKFQNDNNLLIIDNANKSEQIIRNKAFLRSLQWKVLITSRVNPESTNYIEIDKLPLKDARKLFEKHYGAGTLTNIEKLNELLEHINRHSLLTELLAKIGKLRNFSAKQLLDLLEKEDFKHPELQREIEIGSHSANNELKQTRLKIYIKTLFEPEKIDDKEKQKLLRYFSVLPAQEISMDLLKKFVKPEKEIEFEEGISELYQNGWFTKNQNKYKMHQLVQAVVFDNLKPDLENCFELIDNFAGLLSIDAYGNRLELTKYIPFAESIVNIFYNEETFQKDAIKNLATLINNLALVVENLGDYNKSLEFHKKAIKIWEEVLPANHPDLATSYNNVALTYGYLCDYNKSLEFGLKDIKICKEVLPANHPSLATSYNNVAETYRYLGDYNKSLEFHKKAMKINEEVLPANHPSLAVSYWNIAATYYDLKKNELAKEYIDKSVDIFENALPANHPYIKNAKSWQEVIYKAMGLL
ncbi:MAG: tetratricopeptide repeat protein [Bacteroidetes bacterium]|nr:tetratricopeptide repeat protein [Bacteroidota bacterium]